MTSFAKNLIILAVLVAAILFLGVGYCSQRDKAKEARNAQTQSEARTVSATEAIEKIEGLNQRGKINSQELEEAKNAIRQANPSDRRRVGDYQLCKLQQRPDCNGLLDAR